MTRTAELTVVVPVYNEQEVLRDAYYRIKAAMGSIRAPFEIIFVNDGSTDSTSTILDDIAAADKEVKVLSFSRNFGHEAAISAGIDFAVGRAVVFIDADLQDPPEVIPKMVMMWKQGYDVVYGKRIKREGDTLFKRVTAGMFYRFLRTLSDQDIPMDVGMFRLIDRKVCDVIKDLREKGRFLRGLISWAGFRQTGVEYVREKRPAGATKYPLGKMIKLSIDAVTSFSYKPLKLATYIGFIISFFSFIYLMVVLFEKFFTMRTVLGWTSIVAINLFFNGVVLIILGIMGEYIGRIYEEAKDRPLYILSEKKNLD